MEYVFRVFLGRLHSMDKCIGSLFEMEWLFGIEAKDFYIIPVVTRKVVIDRIGHLVIRSDRSDRSDWSDQPQCHIYYSNSFDSMNDSIDRSKVLDYYCVFFSPNIVCLEPVSDIFHTVTTTTKNNGNSPQGLHLGAGGTIPFLLPA